MCSAWQIASRRRTPVWLRDLDHGLERFSGVAETPGIFGKDIAGDGAGLSFIEEAGAADERGGGAVVACEHEVGTGGASLPLIVAHGEEGEGIGNAAVRGPTEVARDIAIGGVAMKDGLGVAAFGAAQEQAFGLDGFGRFHCFWFQLQSSLRERFFRFPSGGQRDRATRPMRQPYSSSRTGQMEDAPAAMA